MEKEPLDEPAMSASGRELDIGLDRRLTPMGTRDGDAAGLSMDQRRRMSRRATDLGYIVPVVPEVSLR